MLLSHCERQEKTKITRKYKSVFWILRCVIRVVLSNDKNKLKGTYEGGNFNSGNYLFTTDTK